MKKTLLIITALMLVVGCSKETAVKIDGSSEKEISSSQASVEKEPMNYEKLIEEDGLVYHPDTKELYSGDVFKNYLGGKTEFEGSYKDGKPDGLWTAWQENGQKFYGGTYKDGNPVGKWTGWHENGQKLYEETYKDGKSISEKCWDQYGNEIDCG
jgi:hypothetical protein